MNADIITTVIPLSATYFNNTLFSYATAAGVFVGVSAILWLVRWMVIARLAELSKKTGTDIDDIAIRAVRSITPAFYYYTAFFIATRSLVLPGIVDTVITGLFVAWLVFRSVKILHVFIDYIVERRQARETSTDSSMAFVFLGRIAKWSLWLIAGLLVLSNLGVNITSLVAGLGIGGLAIAFALQRILGDLFSSFAIWFDKPFEIGDFIVAGDVSGTVETIGIKTTRLRALQGEEIVMANQELTASRIHNYKKMSERRIVFEFGTVYEVENEKLVRIPERIADIFDGIEKARLDRAHLKSFGDSALIFEVVYYVLSSDYTVYMDIQQRVNLELKAALEADGIDFAYPTTTTYVHEVGNAKKKN